MDYWDRKFKPLDIGNFLMIGERKVVGFYFTVKNMPGVLHMIAEKLAERNINIVAINFSPQLKPEVEVSLFVAADLTGTSVDPEEFAKEFQGDPRVKSVEVVRPFREMFLVNTYNFPIVEGGERAIVFSKTDIEMVVVGIRRRFGAGGVALLYHWGVITGDHIAKKYMRWGIETLQDALRMFQVRSLVLGRGILEVTRNTLLRTDPGAEREIVLRMKDHWECEVARENSIPGPAADFTRGVVTGFVKRYVGEELTGVETKCIAMGDSYCEIKVAPS